ncbi:MAG: hypothetical protein MZV63_27090 [Marinilabiliales bacterium]|nr:hypothetical protein [Marinilabiliales bacterium]
MRRRRAARRACGSSPACRSCRRGRRARCRAPRSAWKPRPPKAVSAAGADPAACASASVAKVVPARAIVATSKRATLMNPATFIDDPRNGELACAAWFARRSGRAGHSNPRRGCSVAAAAVAAAAAAIDDAVARIALVDRDEAVTLAFHAEGLPLGAQQRAGEVAFEGRSPRIARDAAARQDGHFDVGADLGVVAGEGADRPRRHVRRLLPLVALRGQRGDDGDAGDRRASGDRLVAVAAAAAADAEVGVAAVVDPDPATVIAPRVALPAVGGRTLAFQAHVVVGVDAAIVVAVPAARAPDRLRGHRGRRARHERGAHGDGDRSRPGHSNGRHLSRS